MRWISGMVTAVMAVVILGVVVAFGSGSAGAAEQCSATTAPFVLCVSPDVATNTVREEHVLTATVTLPSLDDAIVYAGQTTVSFAITSDGTDPVLAASCITQQPDVTQPVLTCSVSYTRTNPGNDTIVAGWLIEGVNLTVTVHKTWELAATPTPTPTATETATPTPTPTPPPAVEPTITTTSSPTGGDVAPGTSPTDTATVGGAAGAATGTVAFFLCTPAQVTDAGCPDGVGAQVGASVSLLDGVAMSEGATPSTSAVGTYCWRAVYTSTDADYLRRDAHEHDQRVLHGAQVRVEGRYEIAAER